VSLLLLQDQGGCAAGVAFAITAAAEAAVNVRLQQSWDKLSLSEQDLGFCRWGLVVTAMLVPLVSWHAP
jgi:hypothetical protein